jgi:hypothetical protein
MSNDATRDHNTKHRQEQIAKGIDLIYRIDQEIADLTAAHLKDLREDKSAIFKRLREDYQMPAPLMRARYAAYKLERAAIESEDDVTLDAIHEMFDILPVGGQGSLMPGLAAPKKAAAAPKPTPIAPEDAERLGVDAFVADGAEDAFPANVRTKKLRQAWLVGWHKARALAEKETGDAFDETGLGESGLTGTDPEPVKAESDP